MASGWTNRGKYMALNLVFRNATEMTVFYLYSINSTPSPDTNTYADITEASNYDGPISVARDATDFDVLTEDDTGDQAYIQIKDQVFTASGGTFTTTYAMLTDDNAIESAREVYIYWDYGATQNIANTNTLTLQDLQITIT